MQYEANLITNFEASIRQYITIALEANEYENFVEPSLRKCVWLISTKGKNKNLEIMFQIFEARPPPPSS